MTTISPRGKPWTTLLGEGIIGYRFSAFWLSSRGCDLSVIESVFVLILCCQIWKMSSDPGSQSILQDAQDVNSASWGDRVDSQPAENSDIHDSVLKEIVDDVVEEEIAV